MKDFKNFLKSESFFNSRNSDQNLSSLVLAFIKNNYAPKYLKLSLIMFSVLFLPAVNAASANNISILYGWNGTSFVPATITNTGALLTTINMWNIFCSCYYNKHRRAADNNKHVKIPWIVTRGE